MPTNTTNFGLIKPGQEEFYDVNVSNENMEIIDVELKRNADGLTTHLADNISYATFIDRDASLTGDIKINLPFKPKNIIISGVIEGSALSCLGQWAENGASYSTTKTSTGIYLIRTLLLQFTDDSVTQWKNIIVELLSVADDGFTMRFTNPGGLTGTVRLAVSATTH